ncbi:MAG: branched-chain amino acid ABC transporter permease [Candidatus Devosia phytovorans]|uniref:Branched-chain amino acid ABC transporter permease n=1 Tax=Candidatus Devosia phytovorans TaxID=3121372 RepID=A0AAJ6AZC5_9HYPH|nr:branched-chain amino acid ABC transporter permease [Devosia sp.]WEK04445.1 MAG: branched-chain amino acid ABC transporter permease [Devosia sp.]
MIRRSLTLFAGLFVLILVIGWAMGLPFTSSRLVEAAAYSLIALGLNIQWGYGGLFNFGIMGFLMLGGFAVTFISYPVNPQFWGSDGPWMLGRALIAFAAGALLVYGARQSDRVGIRGGWKTFVTVLAWFVAYCVYRSQIDPAAAYIEANAGFVGGLGGHPVLGWLFGGVLAAAVAFVVGKIALGLRTDYLAIATIGISEIIRALIKNMDWLTRGTLTVSPIPWPTNLPQAYQASGSSQFESLILARGGFLLLAIAVLAVALFLISRAYAGPWGRMMRAIRDNHIASASMGKNVTARQLEIFVFGSVLMGIGGAMLVSFTQIFDPSSYQPINHTFLIWVMIIVGGAGNNWGAVFGAVLIWLVWVVSEPLAKVIFDFVSYWSSNVGWGAIPEIESRSAQMRVFVLGLVITIALRWAPKGLIPEAVRREG